MISDLSLVLVGLSFFLTAVSILQRNFKKQAKLLLWDDRKKTKHLPVPTVGLLTCIKMAIRGGFSCAGTFAELGKLGPMVVVSVKWLHIKILFINDLALAKDLFQNPIFCGRLTNEIWTYYAQGNNGLLSANGAHYEEQRKFIRRRLKDAGFGTKSMESFITTEIDDLLEFFKDNENKVLSPNKIFYQPILNTLWMIIAGQRFSNTDNEMSRLALRLFDCMARSYSGSDALLMAQGDPIIGKHQFDKYIRESKWMPSFIFPGLRTMAASLEDLRGFFDKMIGEKQASLKMTDDPGDFVTAYLQAIESTTNENSTFYKDKGFLNLKAVLVDFFMAGGDTTSTMLSWCMLMLVRNPEVQKKIQEEIDTIVGPERRPNLNDRPKCAYTEAFIHETLRTNSVTNGSVPHCTIEEAIVGPYLVEKGTMTLLNIAAIHHNPKYWDDPKTFRPERFLSPDGTTFVKNEAMVAFSIGRRRCTGEQLAKDNLFLVVSSILQKFDLKKDPRSKKLPSSAAQYSAVHTPQKYYMTVESRKFSDSL